MNVICVNNEPPSNPNFKGIHPEIGDKFTVSAFFKKGDAIKFKGQLSDISFILTTSAYEFKEMPGMLYPAINFTSLDPLNPIASLLKWYTKHKNRKK